MSSATAPAAFGMLTLWVPHMTLNDEARDAFADQDGDYWPAALGGQTAGVASEWVIGDAGHLAHALDVWREIRAT
jgi:hypothetical protein